jgi:hypothetical protein
MIPRKAKLIPGSAAAFLNQDDFHSSEEGEPCDAKLFAFDDTTAHQTMLLMRRKRKKMLTQKTLTKGAHHQ